MPPGVPGACEVLPSAPGPSWLPPVYSRPFAGTPRGWLLGRMLGFLQRPVVVTADVNLHVVALTAVGLLSRLWRLTYPRAVV